VGLTTNPANLFQDETLIAWLSKTHPLVPSQEGKLAMNITYRKINKYFFMQKCIL